MSTIKIETLTPVHVGSGNLLCHNTDFVQVTFSNEPQIIIISEEKIWTLLGKKHVDHWLDAIAKRENLKAFLKRFAPEAKSKDYAKRRIPLYGTLRENDTLKECMHNGMGLPYIPGSSIKGAIRTAIMSSFVSRISDKESKILVTDWKNKTTIEASVIEKELFGNDPNSNIFRFVHVGDAYFDKEAEISARLINLNIRQGKDSLQDDSKSQLVEAIGTDSKSEFRLKIAKAYYDFVKLNFSTIGHLPVASINDLFRMINEHTRQLVKDEISIWRDVDKFGGEDYIEEMKKILSVINDCSEGEACVLRIGHASGWRFITGAWAEELRNFKDEVIPASRPRFRDYEEYIFPKTRRLDEDSYIFGFVKLSQ